jgi:hypothetical protein
MRSGNRVFRSVGRFSSLGIVAVGLMLLGCGTGYVPTAGDALRITGDNYVKGGHSYSRDVFGRNLPSLVKDDPVALGYARSAQRTQILGLGIDAVSVATGVVGIALAIERPDHHNDPWAQVMLNTSLLAAFVGPWFHARSGDRELDAVNAFNDRARVRHNDAPDPYILLPASTSSSLSSPQQPRGE